MKMPRRLLSSILLLAALILTGRLCAQMTAPAPSFVLVDEKTPPCPVVVLPKTAGHERQAAVLLTNYLTRISGQPFKIVEAATPPEGRAILVGAVAGPVPSGVPGDGFAIKADGQTLRFMGATPMATAFAVTTFLEENLGCRFWSWDEEEIPSKPAIVVGPIERTQKAVFLQGEVWNEEAQTRDKGFVYKARGKSTETMTGNHTLYTLLTPWAKAHPDAWPLDEKTGKRGPNDLHFCYLATGIAEALAEALGKVVEAKQGNVKNFIYFAGMGDWYGGTCRCDTCQKVYEEEKWTRPDGKVVLPGSSTLLRMINRTAELLEQKYPGVRVGTLAYMSLEAPPGLTKPRDNVIIQIPHLRHCQAHPVEACDANYNYRENVKRWCELAPGRVYIWDYNVNFGGNFMYPFPTLHPMAENLRYYAKLGCAGVAIQGNYVSMGSDLIVAKNYVLRKVMWNPELKTEDLLAEFCKGYYGPVAAEMLDYIHLQEGLAGSKDAPHFNEFIDLPTVARNPKNAPAWLGAERIADYHARLDAMLKKCAGQEPWTRRVKEAWASVEAVDAWGKPALLVDKGDHLERVDRGDTYARVRDFLKYTRNCSPGEFGNAPAYHRIALAQQGGPLFTLTNAEVTVKVAPAIASRIWQIQYRGKPVLWVPKTAPRGYPYMGGSFSRVFSTATTGGVRTSEAVGQSSATKVSMEGEAGIESWGRDAAVQMHTRTVEMLPDGALRVTGTARRVLKTAGTAACAEVTQYEDKPGEPGPVLQAQMENGEWQVVALKSTQKEEEEKTGAGPGLLQGQAAAAGAEVAVPAAKAKPSPGAWKPAAGSKDMMSEVAIPAGAKALRIHLSSGECVIEDRYLSPVVKGGKAFYNATTGVLSVLMDLEEVPVPAQGEGTWMVREMRFSPLETVKKAGGR